MAENEDTDEVKPKKSLKRLGSVRAIAIKKGVLTHEVDEGSPCSKCGDSCPGFSLHFWRKICKNCLCPREEHDIRDQEVEKGDASIVNVGKLLFSPTADTLTRKGSEGASVNSSIDSSTGQETPNILKKLKHNYVWVPKGCSVEMVRKYFESLPADKTPVKGTPGERYRQKQIIRQLPAYDVDTVYCNELIEEEMKQMELFIKIRREKYLGRGEIRMKTSSDRSSPWTCEHCKGKMKSGEVAIFAELAGWDKCWHPACFICTECKELLIDLIYFIYDRDGQIYCGRHHAEKMKPRCAACDELILCKEYTRAEDSDWHLDHFCCLRCDVELGGSKYRPQDGMPFCLQCYEIAFSSVCETCGKTITLDEPRLTYNDLVWHARPECFYCVTCNLPLIERPFLPKLGKLFCSKEHYQKYKSTKPKKR